MIQLTFFSSHNSAVDCNNIITLTVIICIKIVFVLSYHVMCCLSPLLFLTQTPLEALLGTTLGPFLFKFKYS